MGISFIFRHAGFITIWYGFTTVHFFPKKEFQIWGKEAEEYDRFLRSYGLGPLILICLG